MPFVSVAKAMKFPAVKKKYRTTSGFLKAVRAQAKGAASWAKRPGTISNVSQKSNSVKINTAAIPGVPALKSSGRK